MLADLIDLLREKGVSSLKWGDVEVTLGSKPDKKVAPTSLEADTNVVESVDIPSKPRKIVKEGVKGKDGLYAEQQEEMYGEVIDAIPAEYEE